MSTTPGNIPIITNGDDDMDTTEVDQVPKFSFGVTTVGNVALVSTEQSEGGETTVDTVNSILSNQSETDVASTVATVPPPKIKTPLLVSIDTERDGNDPLKNSLLEIGICSALTVSDYTDCSVVDKFVIMMKPAPGRNPDPKCITEFWDKTEENKQHYAKILVDGVSPEEGMQKFRDWLKKMRETYETIIWLFRPVYRDYPWIEHWYGKFVLNTEDVQFPGNDKVRCITSMGDGLALIIGKDLLESKYKSIHQAMTHNADDDAHHQLDRFIVIHRSAKEYKYEALSLVSQIGHRMHDMTVLSGDVLELVSTFSSNATRSN